MKADNRRKGRAIELKTLIKTLKIVCVAKLAWKDQQLSSTETLSYTHITGGSLGMFTVSYIGNLANKERTFSI